MSGPNADRHRRQCALRQCAAARADRGSVRARKPRACAGDGVRAEGDRRRAPASASSTRPRSTRRTAPAPRARAGSASTPRCRSSPRSARRCRPAGAHRRARGGAMRARSRRSWTCCRSRRSSAARPTCWSPPPRPAASVNVKKGQFLAPWDMANVVAKLTGAGNRERAGHRARRLVRLQHAGLRHARAADPRAQPARR